MSFFHQELSVFKSCGNFCQKSQKNREFFQPQFSHPLFLSAMIIVLVKIFIAVVCVLFLIQRVRLCHEAKLALNYSALAGFYRCPADGSLQQKVEKNTNLQKLSPKTEEILESPTRIMYGELCAPQQREKFDFPQGKKV